MPAHPSAEAGSARAEGPAIPPRRRGGRRTWLAATALAAAGALLAGGAAALTLTEVSERAGIVFHRAGDPDDLRPSFLEMMGGGACWLDYDRDGWQDLFLVNGWVNDTAKARALDARSALYRNLGDGTFRDVSRAARLDLQGWTQGCSAADYDADGWEDLLVVGFDIQWLFHNEGDGSFRDATAGSGISAIGKCPRTPCWGTGAAWADYDRDDCLDVYVINFVEYNITEGGPVSPGGRNGQPNQLYRSRCDGTFTDVTNQTGTDGNPGPDHAKDWATSWLDYDRDGWLDIYVASDAVPNILLRNNGNGTFTDQAKEAGVDDPRNGMGLAIGDCDDDGWEDLFFTHYQGNGWPAWDGFWTNNQNSTFRDRSGEGDLHVASSYVRWGTAFADLDNDGDVDLHVVSGHTEVDPAPPDQPALLWLGDGACGYTDARAESGPAVALERSSRGSAYADYDLDGDLDIVVVNLRNQSALLQEATGVTGNWLHVELRQPGKNPRAAMAEVNVTLPDGKVLHRRMNPWQSIHSSNPAMVHFGLGAHDTVNLTVRWPDLTEDRFPGVAANQVVRVLRAEQRLEDDTLAPRTRVVPDRPADAPGWWRAPVQVSVAADDLGVTRRSGVSLTLLGLDGAPPVQDPPPLTLGEGRHTLRVQSMDRAGNEEPAWVEVMGVDSEAPASRATLAGDLVDGWWRGPVRATLACDDATSGVRDVAWRLDQGPWTPYQAPFDLDRPGERTFAWRCADVAGNVEPEQALAVAIDLGHPDTRAALDGLRGDAGWWRSAVRVALDPAGGLHPVTGTWWSWDGGPFEPYAGPVTLTAQGVHTARFWSEDAAGRVEPLRMLRVDIDSVPPAIRVSDKGRHVDAAWALIVGPFHGVTASATDAVSGVARLRVASDGEPLRDYTKALKLRGEGDHVLDVVARDVAGNEATLRRDVHLDLTPPVVAVLRPEDQSVNVEGLSAPLLLNPTTARAVVVGAVPFEGGLADAVAGPDLMLFLVDGQVLAVEHFPPYTWTWSVMPSPRLYREVRFVGVDRVGNVAAQSFGVWSPGSPELLLPIWPRPHDAPLPTPAPSEAGPGDPPPPFAAALAAPLLALRARRRR